MEDKAMTKVKDLTPASKQVNVLVKVVSLSEEREITSKFGEARKLVEATVGDETGTVLLTLWNDQIGQIHKDETLLIDNGYVTLVRGHIRLNLWSFLGSRWLRIRTDRIIGAAEAFALPDAPASGRCVRAGAPRAGRSRTRGRSPPLPRRAARPASPS